MRFIDEVTLFVRSGRGGSGCASFKRPPSGLPDGGDGGQGGSVFLEAHRNVSTLIDLHFQPRFLAPSGQPGTRSRHTGASAKDVIIRVPIGTLVTDQDSGTLLADLNVQGERCCVARGGRGGRGNCALTTPTNKSPVHAEEGGPSEERTLALELKLLADIGLIGFPNAGKSTLISRISSARPRIADYPFTTLVPNLGVVRQGEFAFVVADIPGLIEGASQGAGLGTRFLRHVERSRAFLHLVTLDELEPRPALERFQVLNRELERYSPELLKRPQWVVFTKLDACPDRDNLLPELRKSFEALGQKVYAISAITGEGLRELIVDVARLLQQTPAQEEVGEG